MTADVATSQTKYEANRTTMGVAYCYVCGILNHSNVEDGGERPAGHTLAITLTQLDLHIDC